MIGVIDPELTKVIHRDLHRAYPLIDRGEGIYLYDTEGKRYIDGSGGSAVVTAIGHGVPEIVEAMTRQAQRLAFAPTHAFSTEAIEECARLIVEEFAPPGLERVWFVSGGSEATENAVKMALQYQRDRGQGTRHLVIGRWGAFHGATLSSLSYGGNTGRRRKYQPVMMPAEHIEPCFPYRCAMNGGCPPCDLSCAHHLEHMIRRLGPENVAAFIAEPVVGATLGAVPATPGYFQEIREICDRSDVLFIADEVMTGFGRTGKNFGIDHWGVVPDPIACATGVAVLRYVLEHDLVRNSAEVGAYFLTRLQDLKDRQPIVGDVRGLGLLTGVEFVRDRATKEPFPAELQLSKRIAEETLARGLVSYPLAGTIDGLAGDHLLYGPPLIITRDQIDELIDILDA